MTDPTPPIPPPRSAPALRFDWNDWLPYLDDEDIPIEKKRELIESLWAIVVAFVDFGWTVTSEPDPAGTQLDLAAVLTAAAKDNKVATDGDSQEDAA